MRRVNRIVLWSGAVFGSLIVLALVASFFIDDILGRRIEDNINRALEGYRVSLQDFDFNPIGLSVSLQHITLVQKAYPDPPVGRIDRLKASVHWGALLRGRLVGDFLIERPDIHINLAQLRQETAGQDATQASWQEAARAIYPLNVNMLVVENGRFTYVDQDSGQPLTLNAIRLTAENIRNVDTGEGIYPSPFTFSARVLEEGQADIQGRADFLAEPHLGLEAELTVEDIELADLKPIAARHHIVISGGRAAGQGRIEYAPGKKAAHFKKIRIEDLKMDYLYTAGAEEETAVTDRAAQAAREAGNSEELQLLIDELVLTGDLGFVNHDSTPVYRLFLQQAEMRVTNLSNRFSEGTAEARLEGTFMGSGRTRVLARFRPEAEGPDFDFFGRIEDTDITALNDLLRAYVNADAARGRFSLFAEMHVQNQQVDGYVKPFVRDLEVYDESQDEEQHLFQRLYEGMIDGVAELLKNESSEKLATKADISGPVENPDADTWQVLGNLIENAFFDIILPGFES